LLRNIAYFARPSHARNWYIKKILRNPMLLHTMLNVTERTGLGTGAKHREKSAGIDFRPEIK
jgi:hypothetical protein